MRHETGRPGHHPPGRRATHRLTLLVLAGAVALVVPLLVTPRPDGAVPARAAATDAEHGAATSAGPTSGHAAGRAPTSPFSLAEGVPSPAPGRPVRGAFGASGGAGAGAGSTTGAGGTPKRNLLTGRAASFDGTTGSWVGSNAALTWVPAPAGSHAGALSFGPLFGSPQPSSAWSGSPQNGGLVPATPGLIYSGAATVRSDGPSEVVQAGLQFFDAAGRLLTQVGGQGSSTSSGTWLPLQAAVAIAPPTASAVALGVVAWSSSVLGQQTLVEYPSLTSTTNPGSPAVVGPLHVAGNRILQANGVPVVLRGVQLYGLQSDPDPAWIASDTIAQAKSWGANMVRVSLGEQMWLSSSCTYVAGYAPKVDQIVNWITSLGMVALLDLHFNTILPCSTGAPQMMADAPGSIAFWNSVASRYAHNPLVAFDLYNEPHDISDQVWLNGGPVMSGLVPFQAAGMQQLYDAVRATGASNLVVVSGNGWGNNLPATLVNGTNIAYGAHYYSCPGSPPPNCSTANPGDPSPVLGRWVGPSASVPVIVSEFGWPSPYDGTFIRNTIAFAQAHGWGWNTFVFDDSGPWALLSTRPAGGPYEPSASGMPVLAALANAG